MKRIFDFSLNDITEIAVPCALAIIFDTFIKIPVGSTGGSVNFSMVPLIIICLRHGPFKGFIASALVYGIITCYLDDYVIQTYPLEYFVAFGSISIVGFIAPYINKSFKKMNGKIISYILLAITLSIWATIRFFAGSIDSVILYKYTFSAAFAYNAPYVFISLPFDFVITALLLPIVMKLNKMYKTTYLKEPEKVINQDETKINSSCLDNEIDIDIKIKK